MDIVLIKPEIPQNTGNIARLSAATSNRLCLIKPLGFELTDKYLKRAGLDYWKFVEFKIFESWNEYIDEKDLSKSKLWFFSTKATASYLEAKFDKTDSIIFGNESSGLEQSFHDDYAERRIKIRIDNPGVRSLNLANAVSIAVFEARRQQGII